MAAIAGASERPRASTARRASMFSYTSGNPLRQQSGLGFATGGVSPTLKFGRGATPASTSTKTSRMALRSDELEVVRGPVLLMMTAHYAWYGLLLIIGHLVGWYYIYYWTLPLYAYFSYGALEMGRLAEHKWTSSIVPMYLSFIPYFVFQMVARDAHTIFGVLWFSSLIAINLQVGSQKFNVHLIIAAFLFNGITALTTGLMILYTGPDSWLLFLRDDSVLFSDPILKDGKLVCSDFTSLEGKFCVEHRITTISWPKEGTFVAGTVLLSIAFKQLQVFIKEYALNLIDRQTHVSQLSRQNADLKKQLKAIKKDVDLDLDSPITKVIKVIRSIQEKVDDIDLAESLDYVVSILSSNQLFMPNLDANKNAMDNDVNKWLTAMITNQTDTNSPLDVLSSNFNLNETNKQDLTISKLVGVSSDRVTDVLNNMDTWEFNVFDLAEATEGRPLFHIGYAAFERYGFKSMYQLEDSVVRSFLVKIEALYRNNPYHNSTHAADVMHAVHFFLVALGLNEVLSPEDSFCLIVAAIIHDLDHPGVNNAFLINTESQLAIRYNDLAVLENHHCARAFETLMTDPTCNIFAKFPPDKFKVLRSSILSMVLATDMAGHFEYIAKFKNKVSGSGLDFQDAKDRQLVMDIAIKCGDISNATKPLEICKKWTANIMEEFFLQGDEEKRRNQPISMFMDRTNTVIPKCQIGFIDYIVTPLYEVWDTYMNEDRKFNALENLSSNREYWKRQLELDLQAVQIDKPKDS
ncbi:hypothetical protein BJ742DRAFT_793757 [Cladochytrium replicatum]|nr:hypothetical protein BJ742DRAFT_793757 [Cladochytrium replicatum]